MSKILGVAVLTLGVSMAANATDLRLVVDHAPLHASYDKDAVVAAPEIDPASAAAAITFLMGGLAVVRGRRKSK